MSEEFEKIRASVLSWLPLLILICILGAILLPSSWAVGFTSDDYGNLVEATIKLPLTESVDGLHRPLRNILFKLSYLSFGLNPTPYHVGIIFLHLTAVFFVYRLILGLGGSRAAAFVGATLFGFFPRNHQTLFWIAAGQDSVVTICALVACGAFTRREPNPAGWPTWVAFLAFAIALGFKETAVSILPLLVLVDAFLSSGRSNLMLRDRWRVYLPFAAITGLYVLWIRGFFGHSGVPQRFYGVQGLSQSLKLGIKFVLNMILPFSSPVEAKQVIHSPLLLVTVLVASLTIFIASLALVHPRKLLFCAGWLLISAAPTAVLGFYTDRYLGLPFIGLAILLGFIVEEIVSRVKRPFPALFFVTLMLGTYALAAMSRLAFYERRWKDAAQEVRMTLNEVRRLHPDVPRGSVFCFINLTHSIAAGQVYVFNTSMNGMLLAWGYDKSVTARWTVKSADMREQQLVRQLLDACFSSARPSNQFVLVDERGLHDVSGKCANDVVVDSEKRDSDLWQGR